MTTYGSFETVSLCAVVRLTSKHASTKKQTILTSFRRLRGFANSTFESLSSTFSGAGCITFPTKVQASLNSLLLPPTETECVVSLLSTLGFGGLRAFVSLFKESIRCDFIGPGLVATLKLRACPLRTDLIVLTMCGTFRSGTLFACVNDCGTESDEIRHSFSSSTCLSGGWLSLRIVCESGRSDVVSTSEGLSGNP